MELWLKGVPLTPIPARRGRLCLRMSSLSPCISIASVQHPFVIQESLCEEPTSGYRVVRE